MKRIAAYPMIAASRTAMAALRGVPLVSEIRANGFDGARSRQSAKRMRDAATIAASAPPSAEQMARASNKSPDEGPK